MIEVSFFNCEMMYPAEAKSLAYEPPPRPFVPRPPLIAPTAAAPAGRPARQEDLPTIYMGKAVRPPPPMTYAPLARKTGRRPASFFIPVPIASRETSRPKPALDFSPLYVAPPTPPPEPRPLNWQSLIPTPSTKPRLAPLPPYTPLPLPPPLVLRRTAPLPLFGLLRERITR